MRNQLPTTFVNLILLWKNDLRTLSNPILIYLIIHFYKSTSLTWPKYPYLFSYQTNNSQVTNYHNVYPRSLTQKKKKKKVHSNFITNSI